MLPYALEFKTESLDEHVSSVKVQNRSQMLFTRTIHSFMNDYNNF